MQQQVNLCKYVVLPIKSPLDAKRILTLYGVFLGFLMLIYLCVAMLKFYQQSELNNLKTTLDDTRKSLMLTASKYPQSQVSTKLLDTNRLPSCGIKFSTYLIGFAKATIPGIWLTEIDINNNGKQILLKGHALQASQAQQFLIQLKQLPELTNYIFELTELTQTADLINKDSPTNQALNFELTGRTGNTHE